MVTFNFVNNTSLNISLFMYTIERHKTMKLLTKLKQKKQ